MPLQNFSQRPRAAKGSTAYTHLELEVSKVSGIDRKVVKDVLRALPTAILNMFDGAHRYIQLAGVGAFEYSYRHAKKDNRKPDARESRWHIRLRVLAELNAELRKIVGRPEYFLQQYSEFVNNRRILLRQQGEQLGHTPKFVNTKFKNVKD